MSKMNEYPSVGDPQEFTQAEKATFLGSAMCIATGTKNSATVTANIPFSDIRPTKLSDLTDDITVDTYDSTSEAPISGKGVAAALGNFGGFQVVSLTSGANPVPDVASPSNKLIYLTKETSAKTDPYTEWIYTGNPTTALDVSKWEVIGETSVDLTQYYTKTEADTAFLPSSTSIPAADGTSITNTSGTLSVANPVPTPAAAHADVGKVLTVQQASDPSDPDEIVWVAPQGGSLPSYNQSKAGKVLAVNQAGDGVEWINAGGGSSNVEQINMICLKNQSTAGKTVMQTVSMTPKQALQSYNSGKTLILNVIVKQNLSSDEIWEQYTYPLSYLGYGWDEQENRYYILYFDYISALQGTGGNLWNGVKGKLDTTDGTWEISSPSD